MTRPVIDKTRRWKGISASYEAKHMWIIKHYGRASKCEDCRKSGKTKYEWANISKKYLRDISDYKELCTSCHQKWDKGSHCRRMHEYTNKNTLITKEGWRSCRTCHAINQRKYHAKQK